MISKKHFFDLVRKFVFDPDPESDPEIPVKSDPAPEFKSKSDPDLEIIFSDGTHCLDGLAVVLRQHGDLEEGRHVPVVFQRA